MKFNKTPWILFAILAIAIGVYPVIYLIVDMKSNGLLGSKSPKLLATTIYNIGFYTHIYFGGIALLTGWSQFLKKWRLKYLKTHRALGKIYIISVLLSGLAGLYIAFYANGGVTAKIGFSLLAILWLLTTVMAYQSIRKKQITKHEQWMVRSYALCFAAVTLRLWLPILPVILQIGFDEAYIIISWLCWVPNILFAELLIRNKRMQLS
ncbi:DUF2306 domain-containing protein [Flavobacteriaceae bacterium S0862]|nr:DUF2306 domain-containing protein [Flavobacteriaceae bacterium S0862]